MKSEKRAELTLALLLEEDELLMLEEDVELAELERLLDESEEAEEEDDDEEEGREDCEERDDWPGELSDGEELDPEPGKPGPLNLPNTLSKMLFTKESVSKSISCVFASLSSSSLAKTSKSTESFMPLRKNKPSLFASKTSGSLISDDQCTEVCDQSVWAAAGSVASSDSSAVAVAIRRMCIGRRRKEADTVTMEVS